MAHDAKKSISLRLSGTDRRKIRGVAARLHARESDVLRFCIQHMLDKLGPFHDEHARGAALMPAFIELGAELGSFFALDRERIAAILDEGVDDPKERVERFDVELLASTRGPEAYCRARLREVVELRDDEADTGKALRRYLYRKYIADFGERPQAGRTPFYDR